MSDGNGGNSNTTEQRPVIKTSGRILGARSASPAKRSAADMENGDGSHLGDKQVPGSFSRDQEGGSTDFDQAMKDMSARDEMDTQETLSNGVNTSAGGSLTTNISATSLDTDAPPPYAAGNRQKASPPSNAPPIDEQVRTIRELLQPMPEEDQIGFVVSWKWLGRVMSRSSEGLLDSNFDKSAREGDVGPIDNSDIVPEGAFQEPILRDMARKLFIPLKPGLSINEDFQVLPEKGWGLIVGWYGLADHQKQIVRYAHNTAPDDALLPNILFELNPPVITVQRVPQSNAEGEGSARLPPRSASEGLSQKAEGRFRGQMSPDDAIQLVSSQSEPFIRFLRRSKEAAGIPRDHKVKIWKLLDASKVAVNGPDNRANGVLSPPESRSASPQAARAPRSKLVLDTVTFSKMEIGVDLEHIDAKDETNNINYNGSATMQIYQLFQDTTIALEEMLGGPGGGEFASDSKKLMNRLGIGRKTGGSKPGSATGSGRTSPAPGGGMMTRGRQRRDGRTKGTIGLTNLGNTCYMNSALQCIRSVEELAVFFLSEKFKHEINTDNPLGHKGLMAKRYYEVLQGIYADTASSAYTPSNFKKTLGSIQPMFSGYGQQDSQEFLSFLVDALHEDLNRIHKKPYNENPDSDDKTVHDPEAIMKLGETYRANHKARNDSVAMDLFSGFYKNTMECPKCDKISITFDPYSLLTVQLPIESTFQHTITFVPRLGKPMNHAIDIDKNATVKTLKEHIASRHKGVSADRLWMVEVYSHKIYKVFENSTTFGEAGIQTADFIFVFELEDVPTNTPSVPKRKLTFATYSTYDKEEQAPGMDDAKADCFAVPVFLRAKMRNGSSWAFVNHPLYITLTREEAQDFATVEKKVLIAVSRMTSRPILTEYDDNGASTAEGDDGVLDQSPTDDNGQISDRSIPSEDGYVDISVDRAEDDNDAKQQSDATMARENEHDDRLVPEGFMDSQYFVSPALRHQLFEIKYAPSENGSLHCSGMQSIRDMSVHVMADRVQPQRRGSVPSSSSGEDSTTSTGSGAGMNGDTEQSETDDMDRPDLVIGQNGGSYGDIPTPSMEDSDEDLPPHPPMGSAQSRAGRRKNNKHGKRKNRNMKTYGKQGRRGTRQNRPNSAGSLQSLHSNKSFARNGDIEDDPYYIKLGEGIVLDWYPEGYVSLFGGENLNEDVKNGDFVSTDDGKGLPFVHDEEVEAKRSRREARKKHGITLDDCFVETGKREVLSEDNAWYCSRCKELRRATKTLEIWTIPDILVVHMKRFGGNRSFRDKIDVLVDYPIEGLDMTDRVGVKEDGKEYIYDLFAVDNHYGGLGGGHYTAMAKNFYDGQWYDYNDSSCSKLSENRLHSAAAYLLFYRRRSDKPLGPQYLQDLVLESRNPQPIEPATDETAEESDSGEGKLGGPNGSLLGSSSALIGAGVGPASQRSGVGGVGAGTRANSSLTTKTNHREDSIGSHNGKPLFGPHRPPHMMPFGEQDAPSWNFDGLKEAAETNDSAETLMFEADDIDDADDAASTTAMMDHTAEDLMDDMEQDSLPNDGMLTSSFMTTPAGSEHSFRDEHEHYSSSHQPTDLNTLHIEDSGMTDDPPTVSIYPDLTPDPMTSPYHDKMD